MEGNSPGDIRGELDDIFETVDRLRAELRAINRRIDASSFELLALRERRDQVESTLESELARAGALIYDWEFDGNGIDFQITSESSKRGAESPNTGEAERSNIGEEQTPASQTVSSGMTQQDQQVGGEGLTELVEVHSTATQNFEKAKKSWRLATDNSEEKPNDSLDHHLIAEVFPDVKESLGSPPDDDDGYPELIGEANVLKRATQQEELEKWKLLPDEVQTCLASFVAARTRHLQSGLTGGNSGVVLNEYDAQGIFARLTKHSEKHRPGYAHGLARDHMPKTESWLSDARQHGAELDELAYEYYGEKANSDGTSQNAELALNEIDQFLGDEPSRDGLRQFIRKRLDTSDLSPDDPRLVRLLKPFKEHFRGHGFAKLRKALEFREDSPGGENSAVELPDGWKWADKIESSRMLVVGADSRPGAEKRINETFQPAEFSWINVQDKKHARKVESWAKRIKQGNVDVVILLTDYVSHSVSDMVVDAVKDSPSAELVFVNRGYGVEQIRQGIENFVDVEPV